MILYLTNGQVSVALLQVGDLLDKFLVRTATVKGIVTVEILSDNTIHRVGFKRRLVGVFYDSTGQLKRQKLECSFFILPSILTTVIKYSYTREVHNPLFALFVSF